jgi:hypothetical protein
MTERASSAAKAVTIVPGMLVLNVVVAAPLFVSKPPIAARLVRSPFGSPVPEPERV